MTGTNGPLTQEDILLEYNEAGAVTARYIHGPGIDEPLAMEKNGQMYYYHADGLGSIIALTDITGAVVQSYRNDVFGNIMIGTPGIVQPHTYSTGQGTMIPKLAASYKEIPSGSPAGM